MLKEEPIPKWLPPAFDLNNFSSIIDFINHSYTIFKNDFMDPKNPLVFKNKIVKYAPAKLNKKCNKLIMQGFKNCNNQFYDCSNCPYKDKEDIFNHITTKDFKKNSKSNIRTPGIFEINRAIRIHWIRILVENYKKQEVRYYEEFDSAENAVNHCFWLKTQKYFVVIREDKKGRLFLTTAYFLYNKDGTDRIKKAYKKYKKNTKKTLTSQN